MPVQADSPPPGKGRPNSHVQQISSARQPSTVAGAHAEEGLCIDTTLHRQFSSHLQLPLHPTATGQPTAIKQQCPSDQHQQGVKQLACHQDPCSARSCILEAGGKLSSPDAPSAATASTTNNHAAGQTDMAAKQQQQQPRMPLQLSGSQQQQHIHGSNKAVATATLASQSCSVPTDLENIDQLFDELVMLDPKFNHALADAPVIQFETFIAPPANYNGTSSQPADLHRTFMTACEVPDSQQQQHGEQCSGSNLQPGLQLPKLPGGVGQQHTGHLFQPEVACSKDLFTWKSSSQSGAGDGRGRLHSLSLDPTLEQQAASGSTGVKWADGGSNSSSGGVLVHTPRRSRVNAGHHSLAGSSPGLSLPLANLMKQRDPLAAAAALLSSQHQQQQQQTPSMSELKYQMDDMRKLHLACVTDVSPVLAKLRAQQQQQQQQQQQAASLTGLQHLDPRAKTPRRTGDSLPTCRTSPNTPEWQPQMSARQQQAAWQGLPMLQPSREQKSAQGTHKSSVGMRASAPSWKRK